MSRGWRLLGYAVIGLAPGFTVLPSLAISLAAQAPHLTGSATLNPDEGSIGGRMCLTRFEPRTDLRIVLSAALNLKVITDSAGRSLSYRGEYDGRIVGEAREYAVTQPDTARPLRSLCVTFRGAVPPFDSNTATADWKGRIVSIGGVLRASEQSRWYPTLYDSATGRLELDVTYDLAIECPTCRSMYVNGSAPVAGGTRRFVSPVARGVLLLAGDFGFHETTELTFVGGPAGPAAISAFSSAIRELSGYYERLLGIPYRERPVILTFRSVWSQRPDGAPNWQFVTWPTIAMSGGIAFDQVLEADQIPRPLWTTLSHEMGHYYFGTLLVPVGPLRWFALESLAEYLSLKAVRALRGDIAGAARTLQVVQGMGQQTLPALDRIGQPDQVTGTYRYQYAPAFLLALEQRMGEDRVITMVRNLLSTPAGSIVGFEWLALAAERAGIPRESLTQGWTVPEIQRTLLADARPALTRAAADTALADDAVQIAAALVNLDSTVTGRLAVVAELRRIVARDSMQLRAHYQIGRIGALTGQELTQAAASLERYLRHPPPSSAPGHAAAWWRLGQIEEHRGRVPEAIRAYRAALAKDPQYAPAREALARLDPSRNNETEPVDIDAEGTRMPVNRHGAQQPREKNQTLGIPEAE